MTDQVPASLVRFGAEFDRAVRRELAAHKALRSRRRSFRLAAVSTTALAAIAVAVVVVVSATTGASPAYAVTQNSDGSLSITLNDLTTGIPALNARLRQMGINETVIPVTPNCPFSTPSFPARPRGDLSETITIGPKSIPEPAGVDGYLAAERLPNGSIGLGIGGMKAPLPSCISPTLMKVQPSNATDSDSTAGASPPTDDQITSGRPGAV